MNVGERETENRRRLMFSRAMYDYSWKSGSGGGGGKEELEVRDVS